MANEESGPKRSVVVRLKFEGVARRDRLADAPGAREQFWWTAISPPADPIGRSFESEEIDSFEAGVKAKFGAALFSRMRRHYEEGGDLRGTLIVVRDLRYGSLDLDVLVEGIDKFAALFDDNFSAFQLALEHYGGAALDDSVPASLNVRCRVDNAYEVEQAFNAASGATRGARSGDKDADPKAADRERRARQFGWLWILSNTSLILPVLLALWVLHEVRADLAEERHVQQERGDEVSRREAALIKAYADRQHDLDNVLVEALHSAASAVARPASGPAPRACGDGR